MIIRKAEFIKSASNKSNLLHLDLPEFTFVGRSNVGKSSLINHLLGNKKLAKTSQTPGRTRLVNYFNVNDQLTFVDLPGYGYHKAGKENEKMWENLMEDYLQTQSNLRLCFVLLDCRLLPSELDLTMLKYLYYYQIPFKVILTKCDKLSRAQLGVQKSKIANALAITANDLICYDIAKQDGKLAVWSEIENTLD